MYKDRRKSKLIFIEEILKLERRIKCAPTLDEIKKMDDAKFEKILKYLWDNLTKKEKNKVLNNLPKYVLKEILDELAKMDEKEKKNIPFTKALYNHVKKNVDVLFEIVDNINKKTINNLDKQISLKNDDEIILDVLSNKISKKINADPIKIKNVLIKTIFNNDKKPINKTNNNDIESKELDDRRNKLLKYEEILYILWTDFVLMSRYYIKLEKDEKELFDCICSAYKKDDIDKVDINIEEKIISPKDKINEILINSLDRYKKKVIVLTNTKNDLLIENGIYKKDNNENETNLDKDIKNNLIKIELLNQALSQNNGKEIDDEEVLKIIDNAKNTDKDYIEFEIKDDYKIENKEIEKKIDDFVKLLKK